MRKYLLAFLLFFSLAASAQQAPIENKVSTHKQLSSKAMLPDKDWSFQMGFGPLLIRRSPNALLALQKEKQLLNETDLPLFIISTRRGDNTVVIAVKNKNTRLPQKIGKKVFQPHFTANLTGAGTGRVLSYRHNIVTQGDGNYLKVESSEGGEMFLTELPAIVVLK